MVIPGQGEERIDEPQQVFLEDEYVKSHAKDVSTSARRRTLRLREGKKKDVQYQLAL
jgi:hypothetical protein